ncbi:ZIP zinc transporter-domain-containing protein [Sphaerosporella brunnea]|uniref:ZIP zinc transporter-domain-containing protein n=1 Tax=Sphaerosporella brunnea TaxID=1250544 RepID=A0A5J5F5Q6_9PEZI|nr:ZIP zinc transporter-domain-containing protein [Sphaerosporella brunnea]
MFSASTLLLLFLAGVNAQSSASAKPSAATPTVTSLADCHLHGLVQYCMPMPSGTEIAVTTAASSAAASALPSSYADCHTHGGETFCVDRNGDDVLIPALSSDSAGSPDDHSAEEKEADTGKENCHFHAGVEHCTGGARSSATDLDRCSQVSRDYNIPLRIGSIFVVLATSSIAVFLPLVLRRFAKFKGTNLAFTIIKQFGTGVIIATGFVHLLTHADLMFKHECVGELMYEATTTSVAMAGLLLAFAVEYVGCRIIESRAAKLANAPVHPESQPSSISSTVKPEDNAQTATAPVHAHAEPGDDKLSVLVMELGIIFHSILIGITLVVAGNSGFAQLLIVIIFHQGFEGLALGTRIAGLSPHRELTLHKLCLATMFALITPLGMAIGIGARNSFNGNDRETLIALGTLDALSAGILVYVGAVEMLAGDWIWGELRTAAMVKTASAATAVVAGLVLMGLLAKWA